MNEAKRFYSKFESPYNVARRLTIANPAYHERGPTQTFFKHLEKKCYSITGKSSHIFPQCFSRIMHLQMKKQCPECARVVFHSPLYDFDWMLKCPIHRVPLLQFCPTCKKGWTTISGLISNSCATCGIQLKPGALHQRCKIDIDTHINKFTALYKFNFKSFVELWRSNDWFYHDYHIIKSINYPKLVITRDPNILDRDYLDCIYLISNQYDYFSGKAYMIDDSFEDQIDCNNDINLVCNQLKINALNKIGVEVMSHMGKDHYLQLAHGIEDTLRCMFCLTFKYWIDIIFHVVSKENNNFYTGEIFRHYGCYTPITPTPMLAGKYKGNRYQIPNGIKYLLYNMDLKWSYFSLYCYLCDVVTDLDGRSEKEKYIFRFLERKYSKAENNNHFFNFWMGIYKKNEICLIKEKDSSILRKVFVKTRLKEYPCRIRADLQERDSHCLANNIILSLEEYNKINNSTGNLLNN